MIHLPEKYYYVLSSCLLNSIKLLSNGMWGVYMHHLYSKKKEQQNDRDPQQREQNMD